MTSGEAVKYKGSIDCTVQILKKEGPMSLMKGAGKWQIEICIIKLAYLIIMDQCQTKSYYKVYVATYFVHMIHILPGPLALVKHIEHLTPQF